MPEERVEVGALARDVSVQVATQVATSVATSTTNSLLQQSAQAEADRVSAENGRVLAENGRVSAEGDRVLAEQQRATEFSGWENDIDSKITRGAGERDGTLTAGKADTAVNLTPYSDESGAFQDSPVISQGTGTDNNTAIVTTGNFSQLREKQGNTVCVNQLLNVTSYTSTTDNGVTFSLNGTNTIRLNGTATAAVANGGYLFSWNLKANHTYLVCTNNQYLQIANTLGTGYNASTFGTVTLTSDATWTMVVRLKGMTENVTSFSNVDCKLFIIDITQWFGSNANIPQDLLDHPDHFFWYYNGSLAYNAGQLKNSDGVKLVCTGRQLWDGTYLSNGYLKADGSTSSSTDWGSTDYILVVPNKPYFNLRFDGSVSYAAWYDKDKNLISTRPMGSGANDIYNAPSNATYIRLSVYKNNASQYCFSCYYTPEEGGEGYSEHYPYEEPTVVDTGSEVLRSAGSVHDVKLPDGTITRNVGTIDLAEQTWTHKGTGAGWWEAPFTGAKACSGNDVSNLTAGKYIAGSYTYDVHEAKTGYAFINDTKIYVCTGSDQTTPTGSLNYELATPTTEQGTSFPENVGIDDYGMMYWLDENDNLVGIPQGAKFFYPVNYKGFTDDLYNRTDGDAGNVVIQSELSASETARDAVDAQLKEALGGTLRQLLAVKANIDFLNTDYLSLDLGNSNWTKNGNYEYYSQPISNIKIPSADNIIANILCTRYKAVASNTLPSSSTFGVAVSSTGRVVIFDGTNPTVEQFKEAMKGVLFAYEKA